MLMIKMEPRNGFADIRQAFPEMDFKLYPLPISFAVHAGEGTIAISY